MNFITKYIQILLKYRVIIVYCILIIWSICVPSFLRKGGVSETQNILGCFLLVFTSFFYLVASKTLHIIEKILFPFILFLPCYWMGGKTSELILTSLYGSGDAFDYIFENLIPGIIANLLFYLITASSFIVILFLYEQLRKKLNDSVYT